MDYKKYVIAFVDVLGYRELVRKSEKCDQTKQELSDLVRDLQSIIHDLNTKLKEEFPNEHIPGDLTFSDSIILYLPVDSVKPEWHSKYTALTIVVLRCIQIAQYFLDKGYLVRGGIDVGPLWTDKRNFVGPAFMNAYFLEQKAVYPVIKLSPNAIDEWKKAKSDGDDNICIEYDDMVIANTPYMHFRVDEPYDDRYERYANIILTKTKETTQISDPIERLKVQAKLHWFKNFLAHAAMREDVDKEVVLQKPYIFYAFDNKRQIETDHMKNSVLKMLKTLVEDSVHESLSDYVTELMEDNQTD